MILNNELVNYYFLITLSFQKPEHHFLTAANMVPFHVPFYFLLPKDQSLALILILQDLKVQMQGCTHLHSLKKTPAMSDSVVG